MRAREEPTIAEKKRREREAGERTWLTSPGSYISLLCWATLFITPPSIYLFFLLLLLLLLPLSLYGPVLFMIHLPPPSPPPTPSTTPGQLWWKYYKLEFFFNLAKKKRRRQRPRRRGKRRRWVGGGAARLRVNFFIFILYTFNGTLYTCRILYSRAGRTIYGHLLCKEKRSWPSYPSMPRVMVIFGPTQNARDLLCLALAGAGGSHTTTPTRKATNKRWR